METERSGIMDGAAAALAWRGGPAVQIAVIGTGFVGLVTGACLAHWGHHVRCADSDPDRIAALRRGQVPFLEAGLPELVAAGLAAGRLRFTCETAAALSGAEGVFLCVGTPAAADGGADLSMLLAAARAVGAGMDGPLVIVQKSTAPVGTHRRVAAAVQAELAARGAEYRFQVVCNPEFLRQGTAVQDFLNPDRVVVGGEDAEAVDWVASLYGHVLPPERIFRMDPASAEMAKYAANSFLAARVSLINEIANLCSLLGADIDQVCAALGADRRIGPHFLRPGVGYGGSCLPKDVQALIQAATARGYRPELLAAVERVNAGQRERLIRQIATALGGHGEARLDGRRLAIWGLAYKPGTDDMRDAPAVTVIGELLRRGAAVSACDPAAAAHAQRIWGNAVQIAPDPYACAAGAHALVLLTEWPLFSQVDLHEVRRRMAGRHLFDARNALSPRAARQAGFLYAGAGRPCPEGTTPGPAP